MPASQREQTRKTLGAWYTPIDLINAVVAEVLRDFSPKTVLDPACGDGRFLQPFATGGAAVTGVDINAASGFRELGHASPNATRLGPQSNVNSESPTSTSFNTGSNFIHDSPTATSFNSGSNFIHDNALTRDWGSTQFDAVIGNPPFLNQLASSTSRGGRSTFGGGPYADAAAEFLALALRLTRPGGRIGLVLPLSLLGTRDAAAIRTQLDSAARLRWMWWSPTRMFDANVRTWAGVWQVGDDDRVACAAPQREFDPLIRRAFGPTFDIIQPIPMPTTWTGLIAEGPAPADSPTGACLGDIATFTADFRDQYYGLVGAVGDHPTGPPLITSGLIEPGKVLWGDRAVTFARHRYIAPRVDLTMLSPALQTWATTRLVPKILIANQTKIIEAVFDQHGDWLPSVPVITCLTAQPDRVLAVLQSDRANEWVRYHAAGTGLSATSVRLSARLLASIPLDD